MSSKQDSFRQLCDSLTDGFGAFDLSGRVTDFNEVFRAMLGYEREELLALRYQDVTPPRWHGLEIDILENQVLKRGFSDIYEKEYRRKDGTIIPVELKATLVRDEGGRPAGMWATIRDITGRKRVEHALRVSEARLREALAVGNMGYLDWDLTTNEIEWSDETCRMYGFDPGLSRPTLESTVSLVHPDDKERVGRALEAVIRGEAEYDIEHRMIRPDGRTIHVHARGHMTRDSSGRALRMLGTVIDITARKQAQENYRELIEQAADGIFVADDTQFVLVNTAFCSMLGYTQEEMLRLTVIDTYPDDERQSGIERMRALRRASRMRFERNMRRKDGSVFPIEATVTRRGDGAFQSIVRDITERNTAERERARLEEQLRQAQKLESLGRLAGGVAHDFNNLLTVIECNCALLPESEYAVEIARAAARGAALTRQLLAFSRKQLIRPCPLDLNAMIEEMADMLQRLLGEDIRLVTKLYAAAGTVMADAGQMNQVMMNLAVNARDAMPGGGTLTIETACVELDGPSSTPVEGVPPGPYVRLTMADTGVGMDEATRQNAFEPFFTTKPKGLGTGLGLSTVYGIVKQSGGWIWVHSRPGEGARFCVLLPRVSVLAGAEAGADEVRPPSRAGAETVLLVEDEQELRKILSTILARLGYSVLAAADGDEAIRISREFPGGIDLLLTDIVLPGMNGRQVATLLAEARPGVRVLYVSGYTGDAISGRGALGPESAFLPKPFSPDALAAKVREVLDGV